MFLSLLSRAYKAPYARASREDDYRSDPTSVRSRASTTRLAIPWLSACWRNAWQVIRRYKRLCCDLCALTRSQLLAMQMALDTRSFNIGRRFVSAKYLLRFFCHEANSRNVLPVQACVQKSQAQKYAFFLMVVSV